MSKCKGGMTWCVHSTNNCNLCFPGHRPDTSHGHRTDNISHTNYHLGSGVIKQGLKKIVSRLLLADKKVINLINTFSDPAPDSLDSCKAAVVEAVMAYFIMTMMTMSQCCVQLSPLLVHFMTG